MHRDTVRVPIPSIPYLLRTSHSACVHLYIAPIQTRIPTKVLLLPYHIPDPPTRGTPTCTCCIYSPHAGGPDSTGQELVQALAAGQSGRLIIIE